MVEMHAFMGQSSGQKCRMLERCSMDSSSFGNRDLLVLGRVGIGKDDERIEKVPWVEENVGLLLPEICTWPNGKMKQLKVEEEQEKQKLSKITKYDFRCRLHL